MTKPPFLRIAAYLLILAFILQGCAPAAGAPTAIPTPSKATGQAAPTAAGQVPTTSTGQATQPAVPATAAPAATEQPTAAPAAPGADKIGSALNLVIGTKDRASVYASYHLVSSVTTPMLSDDSKSVVAQTSQMTADVQGANVHLQYTQGSDAAKEGYIIADKDYTVKDGKPQADMGMVSLAWAGWHLGATFPFSAAASLSTKTGSDQVDGRAAVVYTVDSATLDPAVLEGFRTLGMFPIDTIKGTLWIDQQTGGALKATVDYTMDVTDPNTDKVVGVGQGHLDLEITQVGKMSVSLP